MSGGLIYMEWSGISDGTLADDTLEMSNGCIYMEWCSIAEGRWARSTPQRRRPAEVNWHNLSIILRNSYIMYYESEIAHITELLARLSLDD